MKKIILLFVLAVFIPGAFLFAQQTPAGVENQPTYHYWNFTIERVYMYRLGYIVVYRSGNRLVRTFIPHSWFSDIGGRGDIFFIRSGRQWPSMSVFFKDGEFSHVRLRLRHNRHHQTWRLVPSGINLDEYFRDIEEVRLEFH